MSWLNFLPSIFKGSKDALEVFKENAEKKGERKHLEKLNDMELSRDVLKQFSAEFASRENRTKWDSFVDGLNRLPRPVLTFGVLSFFVLAPLDPERFMLIAKAYEVLPSGYWGLLSVIIGFYFGGRMQLKQSDMLVQANHVQAAKELVAMRKEFRELSDEDVKQTDADFSDALKNGLDRIENSVVKKWLQSRAG